MRIIGATLMPFQGTAIEECYNADKEQKRQAVNQWIRSSGAFDGVIDFAKATADPTNPTRFAATAGSADSLHPGDSGYQAMGDAIDLKLFKK